MRAAGRGDRREAARAEARDPGQGRRARPPLRRRDRPPDRRPASTAEGIELDRHALHLREPIKALGDYQDRRAPHARRRGHRHRERRRRPRPDQPMDARDGRAPLGATPGKRGWEALDPEPIVACYAADALLSTEPFREPYRGRDGVREYVTRRPRRGGRSARLGRRADRRRRPRRRSRGGPRSARRAPTRRLAGTSVLRFDADGLVVEQWDAWNQIGERREPPRLEPARPARHLSCRISRR